MPALTNNRFRNKKFYDDMIEDEPSKIKAEKKRQNKNWTKFYQEHSEDYDDLEEFHD